MDADRLLVYTLRDLERRTGSRDEYEVLMSAALLRKLLLDGERLVDQVNRHYRLELRFRIGEVSPHEQFIYNHNPMFWSVEDGLDPDSGLSQPIKVKRDEFLQRRIMRFSGQWITVKDIIDHLANVEGAVHRSEARKGRHRVLEAAGKFYSVNGLPGVVSQVGRIGRITVNALEPLRDAVGAAGGATWASVDASGSVELREQRS